MRQRTRWRIWQRHLHPRRWVFLDEMGASTKLTRLYARAPKGTRAVGSAPHGHWKTSTFVAGLTDKGFIALWMGR